MKTKYINILAAVAVVGIPLSLSAQGQNAVVGGVRFHREHLGWENIAFDDGDVSALVAYEYHEEAAFWQLALAYTPELSGTTETSGIDVGDYALTPQMNLIVKDKYWRGGLGILSSYVTYDSPVLDDDWTDLYYQFILGVGFPISALKLDVNAYYPFEEWGNLSEFEPDEIEFAVWLGYAF